MQTALRTHVLSQRVLPEQRSAVAGIVCSLAFQPHVLPYSYGRWAIKVIRRLRTKACMCTEGLLRVAVNGL